MSKPQVENNDNILNILKISAKKITLEGNIQKKKKIKNNSNNTKKHVLKKSTLKKNIKKNTFELLNR